MKEIIIGFVSGIVTATGMGGGTILILCLGLFLNLDQHIAQATNLVFFIPTSIVAIIYNIVKKKINFKICTPIIIFGIIGAIIGAKISMNINANNLRKYFGIFLLIIAGNEIYSLCKKYIFSNKKDNNNKEKEFTKN